MKIIAAQINPVIGDLKGNFEKVKKSLSYYGDYDVVVFPELTLMGYPPNDLLLRKGFVEEQLSCLEAIKDLTANSHKCIIIGAVTKNTGIGKPFHNSALVFIDGKERLCYHKQLLPTYNVFDENRYFEAGDSEQKNWFEFNGYYLTVLICEDCWNNEAITNKPLYSTDPVKSIGSLPNDKKNIVITLNASPSHVRKNVERYSMYRTLSKRYGVAFLYVNQVGAQDDLVFDGFSFYVDGNKIIYARGFEEQNFFIDTDPKFGGLPIEVPEGNLWYNMLEHLKLGLKDYCAKTGFKSVVVGSSGGIDSALVLTIAKEALGAENVFAITMPSKFSSTGSVDDSVKLCNNLGIKLYTRGIATEVHESIADFKAAFGEEPSRLTIENMQARIRGRILMEFSNHFGAMVVSTGNKSETSVGYTTIYGDMVAGLNILGDLYKTEVYSLAKWYNEQKGDDIIPKNIIEKAPSAELWEGQKDQDSLPPYDLLDSVLKLYLEQDFLNREEQEEYLKKIENLTLNDLNRIVRLVDKAEFKRYQSPPIVRVHNRSFGFGRNLPIVQRHIPSWKNLL